MAVRDEIKKQTDKFKDMNKSQKADYIWAYYKWWILGALAIVFITVSVIKTVVKNSKPEYISVMFLNSTVENGGARITIGDEFLDKHGVVKAEDRSAFDYSTYLDNNYSNQQSMAGQVKLISMYQAGEVDIVCAPDEVLEGAADVGGYGNLEEILPEGMLDKLIKKGYEPYYYTEKIYDDTVLPDENGNRPYTDGERYVGGIYINNSRKLVGSDDSFIYKNDMADKMVLTIAWNAPHLDHAIEFIEFIAE